MGEPRARYRLQSSEDLLVALVSARSLAGTLGFGRRAMLELELVLREVATNALRYAGGGRIELLVVEEAGRQGIEVLVVDEGPGIADLEAALRDGYSTGGGLGLGLGAVRRLSDALELVSTPGEGTRVRIVKWATEPPTARP